MTVGITGARSTIAQQFRRLARKRDEIVEADTRQMRHDLDRYLICTGYLAGLSVAEISEVDARKTWNLNFLYIARLCDQIFERNMTARICVIGSESGFSGSYDETYAAAKAALHNYVATKVLKFPEQILIALAPHIIWDSGMTKRRDDLAELERRAAQNRLKRWLSAKEVAREAFHLLYEGSPALSGQIIRMRP